MDGHLRQVQSRVREDRHREERLNEKGSIKVKLEGT